MREVNAVDPTHVVLNYGFSQKQWPAAMAALKLLCADKPVDQDVVRTMLMEDIDQDYISEDDLELLTALCGA